MVGYKGVAYGMCADNMFTASTTDCVWCTEQPMVDLIRSSIVFRKHVKSDWTDIFS